MFITVASGHSIMDVDRQYKEIPVDRIDATRCQARQQNIDANVDDLATSIEKQGLFSPILVTDSGDGAYELIAGQRRMKAYRDILALKDPEKFTTIPAFVYKNLLEWEKKAISINENFNQEPMTETDKIAAVTACYNEFGNMRTTSDKTGISYSNVQKYVKFERLPQILKDMKSDGKITLKTALEAANLFGFDTSDIGNTPELEVKECAASLQQLTAKQKRRVREIQKGEPETPVPEIITHVREKKHEMIEVTTEVTVDTHSRMQNYKEQNSIKSIPLAASELIEEGLERNQM